MKRLIYILLMLLVTGQVYGQSVSGRFSTTVYSWERNPADSLSETHARVYQTAQVTIGNLASRRVSFHFYGLLSQDLAKSAEDDPIPRIYHTYLQWHARKGLVQRVRLGRQRVYSGVAYGTVDGIDLNFRIGESVKIGGFAGILVPFSNEIEIGNWDDRHAFGFRVSTTKLAGTKVLVSFMQRNRAPAAYSAPGRYTGRKITFESLEQRLLGLDLHRRFARKLNLYGRLDYDLEQERVRRGQVELRLAASDKLTLSGEFIHRAPLIEANSIFTVFEQNTTQEFGVRGSYRFGQRWFLNGNLAVQKYDGDETVRFGLGVRGKYGSLGYNFRKGYGGQNNGAYAALNYPVTPKLGLVATTGLARYTLFDDDLETHTSLTGSVGLNYRPRKQLAIDILGQGIRNRFSSSDFRIFVKASYWFFKRSL